MWKDVNQVINTLLNAKFIPNDLNFVKFITEYRTKAHVKLVKNPMLEKFGSQKEI